MADTETTDTPVAPETGYTPPPEETARFGEVSSLDGLIQTVVTELRSAANDPDAVQKLADDLQNERGDIAAAVEGEEAPAEESASESKSSKSSKK